jgi:ABC-type cobalamin/Fe3+-siderophores transport system ATPase subunit
LFVTHDLSCLPAACDRLVMMKEGLIWDEGSPHELLTEATLSQLYDMTLSAVAKKRRETIFS